jgi:(4S)-4-hydroxy-5-phosphonooxypentane-2,3-dione isomerase
MYIVTVLFKIKPKNYSEFLEAMTSNAYTSLVTESGCHQFDVCESGHAENPEIFLYEVYTSKEDFDVHLATQHFQQFNDLTQPWVIDKTVKVFQRIAP